MITSERKMYKGNESIHIYGNGGVKLMVESDKYGHITYAFVSAPRFGTWAKGCVGYPTLGSLRRLFSKLNRQLKQG